MIARGLVHFTGISDVYAKAIIVIVLTAVAGVLTAELPGQPWLPPVVAAITALAVLIDPNAGHPAP
jgi:hypothetical protein